MKLPELISAASRLPDSIVAYQAGQPRTWTDWQSNFYDLYDQLRDQPLGYWGLYYEDSYDFSIALFALWATNRTPLLAPDASSATLANLHTRVEGLIGSLPGALNWQSIKQPELGANTFAPRETSSRPDEWQLALSTSGSTGDAIIVDKSQRQIETELTMQTQLWRDQFANAVFAATVSHQHIYGLLFKVLLPFSLQRPFVAELIPNPRAMLQAIQNFSNAIWIASPAQLKRVNAPMLEGLEVSPVKLVVSSGGLLAQQDAARVEQIFHTPAIEMYGSTETGGIAYRQQFAANSENLWQPLPGVEVSLSEKSVLQVRSPYAGRSITTTGDLAMLRDNGMFALSGRADSIVKLEEKRISLTAVERQLELSPAISAARALVLSGSREILVAVAILSKNGKALLQRHGRAKLIRQLRAELAEQLEKTAIPRRFRFVQELPMNAQGKTRMADLAELFERGSRKVLPVVKSVERQGNDLILTIWVPGDLDYFPGNSPQIPTLPSVVQLLWVRHFARLHLDFSGAVRQMSAVKFGGIVRPEDTLMLTLTPNPPNETLSFRITNGKDICASGIMSSHGPQ